jgi:hypothetical protein
VRTKWRGTEVRSGSPVRPVRICELAAAAHPALRRVATLLRPRSWTAPPAVAILPIGPAVFSLIWTGEAIYDLGDLIHAALPRR